MDTTQVFRTQPAILRNGMTPIPLPQSGAELGAPKLGVTLKNLPLPVSGPKFLSSSVVQGRA